MLLQQLSKQIDEFVKNHNTFALFLILITHLKKNMKFSNSFSSLGFHVSFSLVFSFKVLLSIVFFSPDKIFKFISVFPFSQTVRHKMRYVFKINVTHFKCKLSSLFRKRNKILFEISQAIYSDCSSKGNRISLHDLYFNYSPSANKLKHQHFYVN